MSKEIAALEAQIRHHNHLYWDKAAPEISDYEFDKLVRRLQELAPDSPVLQEMGPQAPREMGAEFRHKAPMLSLDKCYSDDELAKWADSFSGDVAAMPKYDGVACAIHYDARGRLSVAATRGDGAVGDDITQNILEVKDVPKNIGEGPVEVRGEVYMRLSVFERFKAEGMANPRNLTAGAVKLKDAKKSAGYALSFAAYDLLGTNDATQEDILKRLVRLGFSPIDHFVLPKERAAEAFASFAKMRPSLDYEIDGVVYKVNSTVEQKRLGQTAHHPRFALAYKFQGDSGASVLVAVEWSVARTGAITPVAIVEPVALSGVTITRASLHHVGFIDKLGLTLGARVVIVRRGGVIPNVEYVAEPGHGPVPIPTVCPSCGSPVIRERDFLFCTTPRTCPRAVVGQLAHYAAATDMLGFGEVILEQAYAAGLLRSPAEFYTLTWEKLATLERCGEKTAKKLLAEVDKTRRLPLAVFLRALGLSELGKNVSGLLATKYRTLDRVLSATEEELSATHGIGSAIAHAVVTGLADAKDTLAALRQHVTIEEPSADAPHGPWGGQSFVFTGKLTTLARSDAEKLVRARGGDVHSSVTKNTTYVVVGGDGTGEKSTKEKAAAKLVGQGVPLVIMNEPQFLAMVEAEPI